MCFQVASTQKDNLCHQMRKRQTQKLPWPKLLAFWLWAIFSALAFSECATVQGQNTQAVPEQTGPVQAGQVQTNQPVQAGQTQQTQGVRRRSAGSNAPPTLGLDQGYLELDTPDFKLKLVKASQTLAALQPDRKSVV